MLEKYPKEVKLAHMFFPGQAFSMKASIAALAAYDQGQFWQFHDQLFANQDDLDDDKLIEIAGKLNLDMKRFREKLADPKLEDLVDHDEDEATRLGIEGTPWIYINGRHVTDRTLPGLAGEIDKELNSQRRAP